MGPLARPALHLGHVYLHIYITTTTFPGTPTLPPYLGPRAGQGFLGPTTGVSRARAIHISSRTSLVAGELVARGWP